MGKSNVKSNVKKGKTKYVDVDNARDVGTALGAQE